MISLLVVVLLARLSVSMPDEGFRGSLGYNLDLVLDNIFVGNQHAAMALPQLEKEYNISFILNVALDLDIRYNLSDYIGDVEDGNEHLLLEYNKVGLVDGSGNKLSTLAAAVYALEQFRSKRHLENKDKHVFPQTGNILVHCHSGQSRSVSTVALYLFYEFPLRFTTFASALDFVKGKRRLLDNHSVPEPHLLQLAQQLSEIPILALFPSN